MTTTTRVEPWNIDAIRKANRNAGYYWFEPGTIRFFKSRISEAVYQGDGGVFFVSSEKPARGPRQFSVRQFNPRTANIDTVGEFCSMSRDQAHRAARKAAGENCQVNY